MHLVWDEGWHAAVEAVSLARVYATERALVGEDIDNSWKPRVHQALFGFFALQNHVITKIVEV